MEICYFFPWVYIPLIHEWQPKPSQPSKASVLPIREPLLRSPVLPNTSFPSLPSPLSLPRCYLLTNGFYPRLDKPPKTSLLHPSSASQEMRRSLLAPSLLLLLLVASTLLLLCRRPPPTPAYAAGHQWLTSLLRGVLGGDPRTDPPASFGPNISACHPSFSDAGAPVYCCPPIPDSTQEVVDFQLPDLSSSPVRVRRAIHLVRDEAYIAKYRRAVAIMKALPISHPHNWWRQANMHCLYCTGSYHQLNSEHLFKVHRSWYFFPWHRAFVYFHEKIMGKLIGDDSFALPYWQWDHPDGMYLPEIFLNGSLDHRDRDAIHLPPTVTDDNYKRVERGLSSTDQIAYNLNFMYTQMVSAATRPELFMGCRLHPGKEDLCNGPGTIESAPHNTLHAWVGAGYNPEREDMGAFYSAARDPVFYPHHTNIDRLWMVWRGLHGNRAEITDEVWLNTHFYFYDENKVLNRVKVRDFLDVGRLGYRYENADMPWLTARPQPAVDPEVARAVLRRRRASGLKLPSEGRVLNDTITVEVPRRRGRPGTDEEEVLVVYGIETEKDVYTKFSVYVNVADEGAVLAAGARAREFAGTFVGLRKGVTVARKGESKTELKLGISELLRDLQADGDESIWVTLVPEGGTGWNVRVGGLRIDHMGWE